MGVRCTAQIVPHVHPNIKHTNSNLSFFLISRCHHLPTAIAADADHQATLPMLTTADADHRRCPPLASHPPSCEAASVAMEKQPSDVGDGCNGRRKKMKVDGYGIDSGWLVA
ncbi:hypothetical protein Dimus_009336 [Dionaea muscipula]